MERNSEQIKCPPLCMPWCETSGETMNPTKNGRAHMFSPCNFTRSILIQELKSWSKHWKQGCAASNRFQHVVWNYNTILTNSNGKGDAGKIRGKKIEEQERCCGKNRGQFNSLVAASKIKRQQQKGGKRRPGEQEHIILKCEGSKGEEREHKQRRRRSRGRTEKQGPRRRTCSWGAQKDARNSKDQEQLALQTRTLHSFLSLSLSPLPALAPHRFLARPHRLPTLNKTKAEARTKAAMRRSRVCGCVHSY